MTTTTTNADAPPTKLPAPVLWFRVVYAALALNFLIPATSYIVAPELALQTMDRINRVLGGGGFPLQQGQLWHMLAVGNVMTLGFLCALLLADLERFYPALPGLAFLKAFSALYSLALAITYGLPAFAAVFVLDGTSTLAMLFFAIRAHRALKAMPEERRPLPLWWHVFFLRPERVRQGLRLAERARIVQRVPTMFQIWQGTLRMWLRVLFRSGSVGTCTAEPVRNSWRARALSHRALRLPFLLAERAIAPWDMSGFESSRERIIRHLLGAHHDGPQLVYDLELLALHEGALAELRERTAAVVVSSDPRAAWLRDLVVFEGYHEYLLTRTERALAGDLGLSEQDLSDPDISLRALLDWCAWKPSSLWAMLRALTEQGDHGDTARARHSRAV